MAQDRISGNKLSRLLNPKTLAVVGGGVAEEVAKHCDALGFTGEIWPVHPRRTEIQGRKCFPTVDDLPSAPDAAFLGINRNATIEVVGALSRLGAGGAVCHASGYMESTGEGPALHQLPGGVVGTGKAGFFAEGGVGVDASLDQEVPGHQVSGGGTGTAEGDGQLAGLFLQVFQGLNG